MKGILVAFKFTCQYKAASQLLPNQKSSTYHSQQHSPEKVFHSHDLCLSQICYCLPLTACCPPHAALARTHPCPAFASMPARFNPRLRQEHVSRMSDIRKSFWEQIVVAEEMLSKPNLPSASVSLLKAFQLVTSSRLTSYLKSIRTESTPVEEFFFNFLLTMCWISRSLAI